MVNGNPAPDLAGKTKAPMKLALILAATLLASSQALACSAWACGKFEKQQTVKPARVNCCDSAH